MKIIREPDLTGATILKPSEMNKIHFGGNHTPLTAQQLKEMAEHAALQVVADATKDGNTSQKNV